MKSGLFNLEYKNHIQGLRGISILLVLFYHLNFDFFEKGYLGVDIFFVISGYVITQRIFNDFILQNKFSIKDFFIRRIKRIYPVLFFVSGSIVLFFLIFGPLDHLIKIVFEGIFTIFGLSNLYFLYRQKDYFDSEFDTPFTHSWSLGIEEQFYLIYPFLLLLFLINFNDRKLKYLVILLSIFTFISFFSSLINSNIKPLQVFYFPLFRFWEFLFGCIIFIVFKGKILKNKYLLYLSIFSLLITLFIDLKIQYIFYNLLAVIFSSLIILSYEKNYLSKLIIYNKPLNYIGKISYSLYLWHLPVIYFSILYINNKYYIFLSIFISFILSILSNKYIEENFRKKKFEITKLNLFFSLLIILTTIFFIFTLLKSSSEDSTKKNLKDFVSNINYLENKLDYSNRTEFYKFSINDNEIYKYCTEGSKLYSLNKYNLRNECLKNSNNSTLLFVEGNSYAANFIPMLNEINILDNLYYSHKSSFKYHDLKVLNENVNHYNKIIYTVSINSIDDLNIFKDIINKINKKIDILILGPIPNNQTETKVLRCFVQQINCSFDKNTDIKIRNLDELNKKINLLARKYLRVKVFNPYDKLCPLEKCSIYSKKNDLLYYRDNSHLSKEGSKTLINSFTDFYKLNF